MNISEHETWIRDFVRRRIQQASGDRQPLDLKLRHTFRVLDNARRIIAGAGVTGDMARAAGLAALYHDIARFDQYLRFGTFRDALSRNHGAWGVQIIKREKRLASETHYVRRLALIGVCFHNRLSLPDELNGNQSIVCNIVRDADKLDILRVMHEHLSAPGPYNPTVVLSLPDDPALVSDAVINAALAGRGAAYHELASVNDFRLLLGTWYYALNFPASRSLFRAAGYGAELVRSLPVNGAYARAREKILRDIGES